MSRISADPDYAPMTKAEAKASLYRMQEMVDFFERRKMLLAFNWGSTGEKLRRSWKYNVNFKMPWG